MSSVYFWDLNLNVAFIQLITKYIKLLYDPENVKDSFYPGFGSSFRSLLNKSIIRMSPSIGRESGAGGAGEGETDKEAEIGSKRRQERAGSLSQQIATILLKEVETES